MRLIIYGIPFVFAVVAFSLAVLLGVACGVAAIDIVFRAAVGFVVFGLVGLAVARRLLQSAIDVMAREQEEQRKAAKRAREAAKEEEGTPEAT